MPEPAKRSGAAQATCESRALLAINCGSSSIRFALYDAGDQPLRLLDGKVDRIGQKGTNLTFQEAARQSQDRTTADIPIDRPPVTFLADWLESQAAFSSVKAVGQRVVHGMTHSERERVTRFDTAFHRNMPRVAKILPIPRRLQAKGVERYGFHGLSYTFLMEELTRAAGAEAARGRVILAHRGNGASLAAVRGGKSIDTSMGFTPTAGMPMSTRTGDLDPGLVSYLARTEQMSAQQFDHMVNHQSGLLGVSETSADLRDLLDTENHDVRAAEAVALFCYQVKKWIGAFAAALGGLDTLVFAGGIGENAPVIRSRICDGLGFLGIRLDETRNVAGALVISADGSPTQVRVIRTDEDVIIARAVFRILAGVERPMRSRKG